jgi:hypothetical protein
VECVSDERLLRMVMQNEISDAKTVVGFFKAKQFLKELS